MKVKHLDTNFCPCIAVSYVAVFYCGGLTICIHCELYIQTMSGLKMVLSLFTPRSSIGPSNFHTMKIFHPEVYWPKNFCSHRYSVHGTFTACCSTRLDNLVVFAACNIHSQHCVVFDCIPCFVFWF